MAQKLFPDFASSCFNLLRHKAIMIGPKLLEANGVRVQKVGFDVSEKVFKKLIILGSFPEAKVFFLIQKTSRLFMRPAQ